MQYFEDQYFNLFDIVWLDSLWLDVARIGSDEQYANDLIPLPNWTPDLPIRQSIPYRFDDKSTIFTLANQAKGVLPTDKLFASLVITNTSSPNKPLTLYSQNLDYENDGRTLRVEFPLLSNIQSDYYEADHPGEPNHWVPEFLDVEYKDDDEDVSAKSIYSDFVFVKSAAKSAQPSIPWKVLRTYGVLTAGVTNDFGIVFVTNSPDATNAYFLDVANAIVVSATNNAGGALTRKSNGMYPLDVTDDSAELVFTLKPLPAGQAVDFNLWKEENELETNLNKQVVGPPISSQSSQAATNSATQTAQPKH